MARHHRIVTPHWVELLYEALRAFNASGRSGAVDVHAIKSAAASARYAARQADGDAAHVAERLVHVLVTRGAYTGPGRSRFLRNCLERLQVLNDLPMSLRAEDLRALLCCEVLAGAADRRETRARARDWALIILNRVVLTSSDSSNWMEPGITAGMPYVVISTPQSGARTAEEGEFCDDTAVSIAAAVQRHTGWFVHVCALVPDHSAKFGNYVQEAHAELVGGAQAVIALIFPPSGGVGCTMQSTPSSLPTLRLAPAGERPSVALASTSLGVFADVDDLDRLVIGFLDSILPATSLPPVVERARDAAAGPPTLAYRAAEVRPRPRTVRSDASGSLGDFLPGLDDASMTPSFEVLSAHEDVSVQRMLGVLSGFDWKSRTWLSALDLESARDARSAFGWTDQAFNDVVAYANMTRAFEHFAPVTTGRTRRRRLDSTSDWRRLQLRRERDRHGY